MRPQIEQAITSAAAYLIDNQATDGHWEEYALPVGASDAWVTAYIGLALHAVASDSRNQAAQESASRAAQWLMDNRPYPAGWGYNSCTGPDADSTAHAVALIRSSGIAVDARDTQWILDRWQTSGGFATFEGPAAWGCAHVDITPMCFRALPPDDQANLLPHLLRYLERSRRADGSWPSYWWRTCSYATHACQQLLFELAPDLLPPVDIRLLLERGTMNSPFDLAFAVGIAADGRDDLWRQLTHELLRRQQPDGGWLGTPELRVTHPACYRPWENPTGQLYSDLRGLMTTAAALSILGRL